MLHVVTHSEAGGHPTNEDAFAVCPHPDDAASLLVALADGQGGRAGGGQASRLACATFLDLACRLPLSRLVFPVAWNDLLRRVDQAVADDPAAGFTTFVAFCVVGERVFGASCGDSAAVLYSGDTPAEVLTSRQAKNPPVGSGSAVFTRFAAALVRPWAIAALTDGVWKYAAWDAVLGGLMEKGEEYIRSLRGRAALPSGALQDDFTLVVVTPEGRP